MPESREVRGLLYADHPHHHTWADIYRDHDHDIAGHYAGAPASLRIPASYYIGPGSRDQSSTKPVKGFLPPTTSTISSAWSAAPTSNGPTPRER
jgi:hypothetical protein